MTNKLILQPGDERPVEFDFADALPSGETISSATFSAFLLPARTAADGILASTTGVVDGTVVTAQSSGDFLSGQSFEVIATATFSNGTLWHGKRFIRVQ